MINQLKKESKGDEADSIEEEKELEGTKWKRKYIKLIEEGETNDLSKTMIEDFKDEEVGPDNF